MTLTTERANPLRQWNPGWGGCSTARRPVAAVNVFFLRRSVFVKRFTHEMALREVPAVRRGRPGAMQPTEPRSRAQPGCATRSGREDLTAYAATGDRPRTRSHSREGILRRPQPPEAGAQNDGLNALIGDAYSARPNDVGRSASRCVISPRLGQRAHCRLIVVGGNLLATEAADRAPEQSDLRGRGRARAAEAERYPGWTPLPGEREPCRCRPAGPAFSKPAR